MADIGKIEKIQKVRGQEGISTKQIDETHRPEIGKAESTSVNRDHFESLMKQGTAKTELVAEAEATEKNRRSLFDEVRDANGLQRPHRKSAQDLVHESENLIAQINDIKEKLATPNLELNANDQWKMRNNLTHIDDSLSVALKQTGIEYTAPERPSSKVNVVEKFLGLLSHGQNQLDNLGSVLGNMYRENKEFSPSQMLLVQVKVNYIQQELEFFTSALNKALESTKTLMNVQV